MKSPLQDAAFSIVRFCFGFFSEPIFVERFQFLASHSKLLGESRPPINRRNGSVYCSSREASSLALSNTTNNLVQICSRIFKFSNKSAMQIEFRMFCVHIRSSIKSADLPGGADWSCAADCRSFQSVRAIPSIKAALDVEHPASRFGRTAS